MKANPMVWLIISIVDGSIAAYYPSGGGFVGLKIVP
jgi:hypothetical protein